MGGLCCLNSATYIAGAVYQLLNVSSNPKKTLVESWVACVAWKPTWTPSLQELHFVASDIALELIGDFAVVCLLSPKKSFTQRPKPGFSRFIGGLPGHAFQVRFSGF